MIAPRQINCYLLLLVLTGTLLKRHLVFLDYLSTQNNTHVVEKSYIPECHNKLSTITTTTYSTAFQKQPTSADEYANYTKKQTKMLHYAHTIVENKTFMNDDDGNTAEGAGNDNDFGCAPWIPRERRNILLHSGLKKIDRFSSWENYQSGNANYLGGEAYWSASLDYVLKDLGFDVIITSRYQSKLYTEGKEIIQLQNGSIHRFVMDGFNGGMIDHWDRMDILCNMRFMEWWTSQHTYKGISISPTRNDLSRTSASFVPHFVHSEKTLPKIKKRESRGRSIFIFAKRCNRLPHGILCALQSANFTLHMQCQPEPSLHHYKREKLVVHGYYNKPVDYVSNILRKVDIVLAFGEPTDSPTPLEALANGAAFIHPIFIKNGQVTPMHKGLQKLGPPYVYNYDYTHGNMTMAAKEIIKNAELALANPFASFIPADYRYDAVRGYVCSNIIEYDACAAEFSSLRVAASNQLKMPN